MPPDEAEMMAAMGEMGGGEMAPAPPGPQGDPETEFLVFATDALPELTDGQVEALGRAIDARLAARGL